MTTSIAKILLTKRNEILQEWIQQQLSALDLRADLISEAELRTDSSRFLNVLSDATRSGNLSNIQAPEYKPVLEMLSDLSRARGLQGFTPSESAIFVFSIKQPLFTASVCPGELILPTSSKACWLPMASSTSLASILWRSINNPGNN